MAFNQTNHTSSAFKMPLVPPSQAESLLFNDIMEEKTLALRNNLSEFLQVYSYRKFDIEFSNFLKHTKRMIQEGQRAGANMSRFTNSSHVASVYSRPSSFNYRPSTFSMINSTRNGTLQLPENNFQPIEPPNPFKPQCNINMQPQVVLPRIEQSNIVCRKSPTLSATVVEVDHCTEETTNTQNIQPPESERIRRSTVPNSYSEVTMIENKLVSDSQRNEYINDCSNSVESLLDQIGFKIVVGLPNSNAKKGNKHDNQLNLTINEKYLSMWSINLRPSDSKSKSPVVILSGTLLGDDKVTVLENHHDAGILERRKENNLVKTKNGLYRLIGHLVRGSPIELYNACLAVNGIPKRWKFTIKQLSGTEKTVKNTYLNFSLDSPAGPTKPTKIAVNHNTSLIKKKSICAKSTSQKKNGKRKYPEYDPSENNNKKSTFHEQLLTSTPKRPKKTLAMFETPSQILKNKFHQNICNKANTKSQSPTLPTVNDSINVTKKRHLHSKRQSSEFLKSLVKTLSNSNNNCTKRSSQTTEKCNMGSSSKRRKQNSSIKNSMNSSSKQNSSIKNSMNSSVITRSKAKLLDTSIVMMNANNVNKSERCITSKKSTSPVIDANTMLVKQKENLGDCASSSGTVISKRSKKCAANTVVKDLKTVKDVVLKKKKTKKNLVKHSNKFSVQVGLFDGLEMSDYDNQSNYNMQSPGKISLVSRTDKSGSETPPLFNVHVSTTTTKSIISEPPTPLSKSREAKALKRVKAPKITLKEEMKNNKLNNKRPLFDCEAACKKINEMLEFGSILDEYSD